MEELRVVDTREGPISYYLVKKPVKNLNLRIDVRGRVALSIPLRCSKELGDELVRKQCAWISAALARQKQPHPPMPPLPSLEECRALFQETLERIYPLVEGLGVAMPALKLRKMRSQWGNCHWRRGYITLNTALARCPGELRDYVALHELVHFLYHDHGPGFYACMDCLMPDWKTRRRALRKYGEALI